MPDTPLGRLQVALLRWLADELRPYLLPAPGVPPAPGPVRVIAHRQVFSPRPGGIMANLFDYDLALPALPEPNDVKTREIRVALNGQAETVNPVDATVTAYTLTAVPEGATVHVYLTDVDGAGNRSEPGPALDFTAVDDVPPQVPGAPTVTAHRQVITADPAPQVEPAPEPAPTDPNAPAPTDPSTQNPS